MRITFFLFIVILASCISSDTLTNEIYITGKTADTVKYLTIKNDTIWVENGVFSETLSRDESQYNYIKLDTWKWPKIVYLNPGNKLNLNFRDDWINVENDPFNDYLLNKDSILTPYSARWDMADSAFREAWEAEFPLNKTKIDHFFASVDIDPVLILEIKQMELMQRGHRTANFISFQERKGVNIDRDIYGFVDHIDFKNSRLGFHENNRNFQYYYFLDKVSEDLPAFIYPFAAIDTVNKYVAIPDIKDMIIENIVKSGLHDETVDHDALFLTYKNNRISTLKNNKIVDLYQQILQLKPGKPAPDFGTLKNHKGIEKSISNFKGENILLTAWGTWCPYCKEELPHLKNLINKHSDKFKNIAISLDKDSEKWQQYLTANNWNAVHLNDPTRKSTFRKNYLISGTNVHYLIDKHGVILAAGLKPSSDELKKLIEQLE